MGHGRETEVREGDLLHPPVCRVPRDFVDALPALIVGSELRRVPVGLGGQRVELAPGHLAHGDQVRPRALEHLAGHHRLAEEL